LKKNVKMSLLFEMLITFMLYYLASGSASSWPVTWDLLLHTYILHQLILKLTVLIHTVIFSTVVFPSFQVLNCAILLHTVRRSVITLSTLACLGLLLVFLFWRSFNRFVVKCSTCQFAFLWFLLRITFFEFALGEIVTWNIQHIHCLTLLRVLEG
jgi:hypothetical protein